MIALDFEYDGLCLSDMGYMICDFDSSGKQIISNGSEINFNTVSSFNGALVHKTSTTYSGCLKTTLQICKNPYSHDNLEISINELRDLMKWLNRKNFHNFKLLDIDHIDLHFEATCNISRIEVGGVIYGLELEFQTNRPFALYRPYVININNTDESGKHEIIDKSDEEGFIYPYMEILIQENGDLSIHNEIENRTTYISNCIKGEKIIMDYPIIQTSSNSHKIQNDFNWVFFRVANTWKNHKNSIDISLPCTITIKYSPIAKVGL